MNILILQGKVITYKTTEVSDILIVKNKIAAIGNNLKITDNTKIIDASGKYVFPGGIDPHVHLNLPTPAGPSSDNFETGTIAAIYGGTTSIIDFVTPNKNESLISAFNKRIIDAKNSKTDYGFHMGITSWNKNTAKEIEHCVNELGITSFKTYMAYKGAIGIEENELYEVMKIASKLHVVVSVHCELGDEILKLQKEIIAKGNITPAYHALSRPNYVEAESVKHVVELAKKTKCIVYIVHTSTKESIKIIETAQKSGITVFSETCPQYLLLDDSVYNKPLPDSLKYVISPPIRKIADQNALWKAIKNKTVQFVATDHCPFNTKGQKAIGKNDFTKIPNGAGGIEHRLALLYTYGVLKNKISINEFVAITSSNPAKVFGIYPQKGEIEVGSDADIVIWNPKTENVISAKTHHQNCDSNIYEGFKTKGNAETVILNGKIVLEKNSLSLKSQKGKYLKRF
ncbi:MAG: dihydropyrimidinase [Bacteroidetes bacterium GWA2_32_17]|nr:MAG: dihydropyrimidinase [Bacteroidetes bacterium GWA2_32_17]